jgi:hypothetical protein
MKTVVVNGVTHNDGCDRCGKHQAMHYGKEDLCCWCHIAGGGTPADWHQVDMALIGQCVSSEASQAAESMKAGMRK